MMKQPNNSQRASTLPVVVSAFLTLAFAIVVVIAASANSEKALQLTTLGNDPDTATPTPTYTVIYDGNGNTGGTAPLDPNSPYNAGSLVGVLGPGSLVKADYMFTGWNTLANGSGTRYTPAQAFIINADTTLYAQWVVPPCAPAGLDPSFDGDGKVTTELSAQYD